MDCVMSTTHFQFDSNQKYQLDAIASVVDLFKGQIKGMGETTTLHEEFMGVTHEIGAIANPLVLDEAAILANLQTVQDRNGLEVSEQLANSKLDFDIEMETGTGKTYVYLRTALRLFEEYGFTKFLVVVPRKAIKEGVMASLRQMQHHFSAIYGPFEYFLYDGANPEQVQSFATSMLPQIGVVSIDAMKREGNVIYQPRDKLNGIRPIDYLKATRPLVIMDEPQLMESDLSISSVDELAPCAVLRYSATHKQQRNLVYRLDPVDAHTLGLVKQIVVAEVMQEGADVAPFIKLLDVTNTRGSFKAKLELSCRKADGSLQRKEKTIKSQDGDLANATGNPAYEGWRINEMSIDPVSIELSNHGSLLQGETIGGSSGLIYKEMIRQTVREHLSKEAALREKGIKVLSLFFVDKVASFLGDGTNNDDANGDFVRWFDEVFVVERERDKRYKELLPQEPHELRRGIFSTKGGKFVDTTDKGNMQDNETFKLIMRDKEVLLDHNEPVRFIFSHSMLGVGWDNPNVFQICTLREMGEEADRRQTLGRGLRLPVAKTEQGYERVADRGIAMLTVVANERYADFAQNLQNEYKASGVSIGEVRPNEFSKLTKLDASGTATDNFLGFKASAEIYKHLENAGFLKDGKTTSMFLPDAEGFTLHLPDAFKSYETEIIQHILDAGIEKYVKPRSHRAKRVFNKELYSSPEFEKFWNEISQKTTYRVKVNRDDLIKQCVTAIKEEPKIQPLRIEVTRAGIKVSRGGAKGNALGNRTADGNANYDLPDIIGELQLATSLTRKTLVDIVTGSGKLDEFIGNPNDFIAMVRQCIESKLRSIIVGGVQYEKIDGSIYELRELQDDGLAEKEFFKDHLYRVEHTDKTDFDHVVFDGGPNSPERTFAAELDSREDIRLFMKLPAKFKIHTPAGTYNPDWAIIKEDNGHHKIYMVRETKSTLDWEKLRPIEKQKIKSAIEHFKEIGIDYCRSTPQAINL